MRIAVITDVHGNDRALEAVLEDIEHQAIDEIVIAGDTINLLPNSRRCWDLARSSRAQVLQGNHEFNVAHLDVLSGQDPVYSSERFMPSRACRAQFSSADCQAMLALPVVVRFPDLMVAHAAPNNVFAHVRAETPTDDLRALFAGSSEAMIVRGHNHEWLERTFDGRQVFTVASCGIPAQGRFETQYVILTRTASWSLERRLVPYDRQAILKDMGDAYFETTAQPHASSGSRSKGPVTTGCRSSSGSCQRSNPNSFLWRKRWTNTSSLSEPARTPSNSCSASARGACRTRPTANRQRPRTNRHFRRKSCTPSKIVRCPSGLF